MISQLQQQRIIPFEQLQQWRAAIRASSQKLVVTNGCFDILHAGHVNYLEAARAQGDCLLAGLNSDVSVRSLKGPTRPINGQEDRALVLAALRCVDAVCIFDETRATRFLEVAQPDIYVKGGDFTPDQLPPEEVATVRRHGGKVVTLGLVPGRSTTATLDKLRNR